MTLPISRDITLGAFSPIPSALLDKLQDLAIAAARPPWWRNYFPQLTNPGAISPWIQSNALGGLTPSLISQGAQTAGNGMVSIIPNESGDRIVGFKVRAYNNGGGARSCTHNVWFATDEGAAPTLLGTLTNTGVAAAWNAYVLPITTPQIIPSDGSGFLFLESIANGTNYHLGTVSAQFDRLI